jgi:SgrR family transcriptional regulator
MRYFDHIMALSEHYHVNETETTVAQISQVLNCTERHVKTIISYLERESIIDWKTQKGRGKKSIIKLLYNREELCLRNAMKLAEEGNYQEAFQGILKLSESIQNKFQYWFLTHLGLTNYDGKNNELDILRYPFYETNLSMDPLYIRSRHDAHMVQQIFDRLVEYDALKQELIPSIAHYWESKDGKLWTFYLHKGIRFHHGRELTSSDVYETLQRLPKDDVLMRNMVSIKIVNKTVIQFQLKEVDYLFPRQLSNLKTSIVPIELIKRNKEFSSFPVGSGPYQLTNHDNNLIRLEVFSNYFSSRPWLDQVEIIKTPTEFKREGSLPFLLDSPDESWRKVQILEEGAYFIAFNCKKKPFSNRPDLREFICNIVNQKEFCNSNGQKRLVAHSFITSYSRKFEFDHDVHTSAIPIQYKDEPFLIAAQQIRNGVNHEEEAIILQNQLRSVGIPASVEIVDINLLSHPETYQKYDIFVGGVTLAEDHLLSVMIILQSNKLPLFHCLDTETRKYIDKQVGLMKETKDEHQRWSIYFKIEEYLKSNNFIFFLTHRFHTVYKPITSDYIGIELNSNGRVDYRKMWKKIH